MSPGPPTEAINGLTSCQPALGLDFTSALPDFMSAWGKFIGKLLFLPAFEMSFFGLWLTLCHPRTPRNVKTVRLLYILILLQPRANKCDEDLVELHDGFNEVFITLAEYIPKNKERALYFGAIRNQRIKCVVRPASGRRGWRALPLFGFISSLFLCSESFLDGLAPPAGG
ncbi:hypothetical protein K438DRAFT_1764765 [Mycena galopus ATCC 62051]|nr:hypothetical protein K438DRAFT_1764765 [Mycena galopus ATCC 62051]